MPRIDVEAVPERKGSSYPAPYHLPCTERVRRPLGDAAGLTDFGVNLLHLPPGAWSSQRHWHEKEDEFVFVVSGEVVLVTDDGETVLRAGDCAGFPKGAPNGHHLANRSVEMAICLEVGTRAEDDATAYSDIDLHFDNRVGHYAHRDGTPYPRE